MTDNSEVNNLLFSPSDMMAEAEKFAFSKTKKSTKMALGLAMMAGMFIGIAFLFYITVTTGNTAGWGLGRLTGGLAFSLGLVLVVICGGELFTSVVLSAISYANKQISLKKMLSVWAKVYLGNFLGAMLLLAIVMTGAMYYLDGGLWGLNALNIAQHKIHHTFAQAFALGILCNVMVCLAVWLTFSSANAMTKMVMVIMPVAMFVSSGFEHSIANMFMIPLGIAIHSWAPADFWTDVSASAQTYADLTIFNFVFHNLIPVTLGNIVGGAGLVGLANWAIFRQSQPEAASDSKATVTHLPNLSPNQGGLNMDSSLLVKDHMEPAPFILRETDLVVDALDKMLETDLPGAPVCDGQNNLVGFISVHDVMVEVWCNDYSVGSNQRVGDLMSREILALNAADRLVDVAEFLTIDKSQLYPVSSSGVVTTMNSASIHERARAMRVHKPHILPVLDGEKFVGVLTRHHILRAIRPLYGEKSSKQSEEIIEAVTV